MEIILKKDVEHLGFVDDLVRVKAGYGRNYLIPNALAIYATSGNIAQAESDYKRSIEINADYLYAIEALKNLKEKNIKYN